MYSVLGREGLWLFTDLTSFQKPLLLLQVRGVDFQE